MKQTVLIFDFDGTIANTREVALEIGNKVLIGRGEQPIELKEFDKYLALGGRELIKHFKIRFYEIPSLVRKIKQQLKELRDELSPKEGMIDLIKELYRQKNLTLLVMSSNSRENIEYFFDKCGINNIFESITSDVSSFGKAKPLKKLRKQYRGYQLIMIGDEPRDTEAAKKAGVTAIAVEGGLSDRTRLVKSKSDYIASDSAQLREILFRLISNWRG